MYKQARRDLVEGGRDNAISLVVHVLGDTAKEIPSDAGKAAKKELDNGIREWSPPSRMP